MVPLLLTANNHKQTKFGLSWDNIEWELQLMHFAAFNGNTFQLQLCIARKNTFILQKLYWKVAVKTDQRKTATRKSRSRSGSVTALQCARVCGSDSTCRFFTIKSLWMLLQFDQRLARKPGPFRWVQRLPLLSGAQSPLKLDSFLHHARGNNLIKVQHRAMVAYHPILDDSQSTNMASK